ncbi:MAG: hypothetical protein IT303_19130 [Dehalococcoidia bacterium]|nr:hypothetical protein [Dehalococcoidia bacterium]
MTAGHPAPRTSAEVIAVLDAAAPLIRQHAAAQERAHRIAPEVVEALHAARLLRLWLPAELDGDDLDLPGALAVFEAASRIDGATGWAVTIGTGGNVFAGFLAPDVAAEVFGPPDAVIAGSGKPSGTARPEGDAYRVSGRWGYASGAHYATWFTANCVVEGATAPDGGPLIRAIAMPAAAITLEDDWDAFGMAGTGSVTFAVSELRVPRSHSFSLFEGPPVLPSPIYRFPFAGVAELSFGAVALGTARHAIEAFVELAAARPGPAEGPSRLDEPATRIRLAEAEAALRSARSWFFETAGAAWAEFTAVGALTPQAEAAVTLASVHAAQSAVRAADLLYGVAGTSPVLARSGFGRAWRDTHVVSQHVMLSPQAYDRLGGVLAGR